MDDEQQEVTPSFGSEGEFEDLLGYLRDERGFDFTGYKRTSLTRRVVYRMQEISISDFTAYQKYMASHPEEFEALFNTILINVTEFFRDLESWDYIRDEVLPVIIERKAPGMQIRVWCAGCASGQEAFTVAMLLAESLPAESLHARVKIYATDIDAMALDQARHSVYTPKEVSTVPDEFRERYFEPTDGAYRFRTDLRRCVIFGRHDLIQDPPISRIDLLMCRNTLMYMTPSAQDRVLRSLSFALAPGGYLFLGRAEALVRRSNPFESVDLKFRVFRHPSMLDQAPPTLPNYPAEKVDETNPDHLALASLDASYSAQLVVDREGKLAVANLASRQLFNLTASDVGRSFKDLDISYRPVELRSQIEQALRMNEPIKIHDVGWTPAQGGPRIFDVHITRLPPRLGQIRSA